MAWIKAESEAAAAELPRGGSAMISEYSRTDTGPLLRELAAAPGFPDRPSTPDEWREWNRYTAPSRMRGFYPM